MRALWLAAAAALFLSACSHVDCAIDTDCPLGKYCAMDTHSCLPVGGGDAGPHDAAPSDGAPGDGAPHDASMDAAGDAGRDASSEAGSDAGDDGAASDAPAE